MQILHRVEEARAFSRACRDRGEKLGLVPTMGYLHEGHLSLIRLAKRRASKVVVSVFVNPLQFGPREDLDRYPRDFERDRALCEKEGADALFAPDAAEMYPTGFATRVEVSGPLTAGLCGARRPGHFTGVATVVTKLLAIGDPDVAVFGQKDAQQALVVKRLVEDLNLPVEIAVAPIVRESDGLAMSSRNAYLSKDERAQARVLRASLDRAEGLFSSGDRDAETLLESVRAVIGTAPLARLDYAELVDAETLEPLQTIKSAALLALAAWFGPTRLIDNTVLKP
jgi:pantoate--beta-alanine ligase